LCYPNVLGLLALRALIACVILLSPTTVVINPWIICPLALLIGLFTIRSPYGQDGADQMAWILITGLALISVVATPVAKTAFLWFIALQSCFSYATAGIAKASAEGWRDGRYLVGICNTRIYGNVHFAQFLASRPALAKLLSLLIIVWESLFPLVLIVPIPFALAILVSGMLFHLANAQIMGLNTFLWSFVATYPAILYCVQTRPW
jgi:hypothetical protein